MSSAMNHRKRSHRSDKLHRQCLYGMKQFAPAGGYGGALSALAAPGEKKMGPRRLLGGNVVSKHIGGWLHSYRKRNRKRAGEPGEVPA